MMTKNTNKKREQIFARILEECMKFHLVDTSTIFVDSTHVKACANTKKRRKQIAQKDAYGMKRKQSPKSKRAFSRDDCSRFRI